MTFLDSGTSLYALGPEVNSCRAFRPFLRTEPAGVNLLYEVFPIMCEGFSVIFPFVEKSVVPCYEPLSRRRPVPADFLIAADDMAYKPVAFC